MEVRSCTAQSVTGEILISFWSKMGSPWTHYILLSLSVIIINALEMALEVDDDGGHKYCDCT